MLALSIADFSGNQNSREASKTTVIAPEAMDFLLMEMRHDLHELF